MGHSQHTVPLLPTSVASASFSGAPPLLGQLALSGAGLAGVLQILARCDITVLQELVDSSGSALYLLLRELNR